MPTTARANRTDGDAEAGAAEAEKCKKARVTLPVLSVLQTVLQHAAEALADKTCSVLHARVKPSASLSDK